MTYVTHLECSGCQRRFPSEQLWNLCPECSRPLLVRYNLTRIRQDINKEMLRHRPMNMWRYREVLPLKDDQHLLTLGEGGTPLHHARQLGALLGAPNLYLKDEGLNPTNSFKARGLAMAVSRAKELGAKALSIPSAGNAAGAMSAYAALSGLSAFVYMPADVPHPFIAECRALGATVTLVEGLITDCGKIAARRCQEEGHFDVSTLKEPYRLEGKKTMGYELAEQMGWQLPDVIIYPTGGGTGLIGMWKAFQEMEALGWIPEGHRPRMVSVQSEGCAPIVKAFHEGKEHAEVWDNAHTIADGLRVPGAVGDFLMLGVLRESGGTAIAVSDTEMLKACQLLGSTQGIFASPEGGATLAAYQKLLQKNWIDKEEKVVLFITGSGHKYAHLWQESLK